MLERNAYTGFAAPHSFAGRTAFLKQHRHLTHQEALDKLYSISSYTQMRARKRVTNFNPIYVTNVRQLCQADLVDMRHLATRNGGVNHILTCVDTFSRKCFARLLKNKLPSSVLTAFEDILQEMVTPPQRLGIDMGKEFFGVFKSAMRNKNIRIEHPRYKFGHIERLNLTLQRLLYMYMNEFNTWRYVEILQAAVHVYNSREHRMIGMSPNEAERPENRGRVMSEILNNNHRKKVKPKLSVGDTVRVLKPKFAFKPRGYEPQFYPGLYRIVNVKTNMPVPMYELTDITHSGVRVARTFYGHELQKFTGAHLKATKTGRVRRNQPVGGDEVEVVVEGFPKPLFIKETELH